MSYCISLDGDSYVEVGNQSYNTNPMLHKAAKCCYRDFKGMKSKLVIPQLETAIKKIALNASDYEEFNDWEEVLIFLVKFLALCKEYKTYTVSVT